MWIEGKISMISFIVPGERVTVVSVNHKCPRDRLVETLSELS
jgi:hypothetical protein